jgi:hypothetical protein
MSDRNTVAEQNKTRSMAQRKLRRMASQLELEPAVHLAVDTLFDFTHSAKTGKALWSEAGTVWLGRVTFLHWSLEDADIDIPWVVAKSGGAPRDSLKLRKTVEQALAEYWTDRLAKLPRISTGKWQPLP